MGKTIIFELAKKTADKVILWYLSQLLHIETEKIIQTHSFRRENYEQNWNWASANKSHVNH